MNLTKMALGGNGQRLAIFHENGKDGLSLFARTVCPLSMKQPKAFLDTVSGEALVHGEDLAGELEMVSPVWLSVALP